MGEQRRERARGLERFLTFVDAVVAIAITLLVLPLVELTADLGPDGSVAALLREHVSQLGAFLLSFAVIAQLWFAQHRVMAPVVAEHPLVQRLLVLWTLTIVVLPFPTALVATEGHQAATKIFYVATMALSSLCLAGIATVLARHREVLDDDVAPDPAYAWATTLTLVLALVLGLAVPVLGYWPLLLLVLTDPVVHRWRRVGRAPRPVGE